MARAGNAGLANTHDDSPSSPYHVILFYKYVPIADVPALAAEQREVCERLNLTGRLLLGNEGVNGTLGGASEAALREYIERMEAHDPEGRFGGIDWKWATSAKPPFAALSVREVGEIVSTGGQPVDIETQGGEHLSPAAWHLELASGRDDLVLIDVRNTYEHAIGHFVDSRGAKAVEPRMRAFSEFAQYASSQADSLKDKRVLMYVTAPARPLQIKRRRGDKLPRPTMPS